MPESAPLVLRTYDVPSVYSAEIGSIIRRLLQPQGNDKPGYGSASIAPGGKLIVTAPEGIQRGVKELAESLAAKKPTPPQSVTVSLWVVAGKPAEKPELAADLRAVAPALEAVMKSEGPMELELIEHLAITSVSGELARTAGAFVEFKESATMFEDKVVTDLDIDPEGPAKYTTRVQVAPGKLLVLGQAGYIPHEPRMPFFADRERANNLALFYVVRAEAAHE